MKLHNGWLIANNDPGYCRQVRMRLSNVTKYAYAETDDITIVWQADKCGEEFKGNHIEALDRYFSEQELA